MGKPLNAFVPLACPHCHADMYTTLDSVRDEAFIQCCRCGAVVELGADDLPGPWAMPSADQYESFWLEV